MTALLVTHAHRTRQQKRKVDDEHSEEEGEGHEDFDPAQLREHEEFTKVKNIADIELGKYEMETWYFSPFPPEYRECKVQRLGARGIERGGAPFLSGERMQMPCLLFALHQVFMHHLGSPWVLLGPRHHPTTLSSLGCTQKMYFSEHDLCFFKHREHMLAHVKKCTMLHPPGTEIYRNGKISMFEVGLSGRVLDYALMYEHGEPLPRPLCSSTFLKSVHVLCKFCCPNPGPNTACPSARWTGARPRATARTCVTWPSSSWTTRRCTGTSTSSSFTLCASVTSGVPTSPGETGGARGLGEGTVV